MTAKECIKKKFYNEVLIELDSGEFLDIQKAMIEFAQYHVKEALQQVKDTVIHGELSVDWNTFDKFGMLLLDKEGIKNLKKSIDSAYPLNNIK